MPKIKIYKKNQQVEVAKIDPHKLGRPYHKIPNIFTSCFDLFDTMLSLYFIKKYRVSISLKEIKFEPDSFCKNLDIFCNQAGNIGFNLDRQLLLAILVEYYGITSEQQKGIDLQSCSPTKTEERLKNQLGIELSQLILNQPQFGEPLECKTDYSSVRAQWAYKLTFVLTGCEGEFHIFLDGSNVDRLLNVLRHPAKKNLLVGHKMNVGKPKDIIQALPVKLYARLASINMTLARLLELREQMILPITLPDNFPIYIGKEQLFSAIIAEERGKLFFSEFNDKPSETTHE